MQLVILEDNDDERMILLDFCARYASLHNITLETTGASCPGELPGDMTASGAAAFFDIVMDGRPAGVDTARELRARGWKGALVFITVSDEFYAEGFELGALHYLVKPIAYSGFEQAMDRVLEISRRKPLQISIPVPRGAVAVQEDDITYAEVYDHDTWLHTTGGKLRVTISLNELEALLPRDHFLRCFRSYIVNMAHIARIEADHIILTNGERAPISRRNRQELQNRYLDYRMQRAKDGKQWV